MADVTPTPEIAVRNIKSVQLGDRRIFTADFSIMSALMNHNTLKGLAKSTSAEHKRHLTQFLKNATVLSYVTAKHGSYKAK
ncbi:hypothetical protein [Oceanospirillum multiglobuliferum]|uniref:hypothetical protein n=1 Tax=Oceanospirillum multiglobuliferum TaxID=64969 RepID=UPI0011182023|nr:hypothetical protein [Oceanospirillum multiglobuliferum]